MLCFSLFLRPTRKGRRQNHNRVSTELQPIRVATKLVEKKPFVFLGRATQTSPRPCKPISTKEVGSAQKNPALGRVSSFGTILEAHAEGDTIGLRIEDKLVSEQVSHRRTQVAACNVVLVFNVLDPGLCVPVLSRKSGTGIPH